MICDRCGNEIKGTTYYVFKVYGKDINPQPEYTTTCASATQNIITGSLAMLNAEKQYCKECKEDIEKFATIKIYKSK